MMAKRELQQRLFLTLQKRTITIKQLHQLHAQLILNAFAQKNFIVAQLLSRSLAAGDLEAAARTFRHVEDPTTTLFNHMIRSSSSAFLLYNQMRRRGSADADPNGFTYTSLLTARHVSSQQQVPQLHARIVSGGFVSNVFVQTALIGGYSALGKSTEAQRVFDEMPERNLVTWNSMLDAHLRSGELYPAFALFSRMSDRDAVSWTTMIAGCTHAGRCQLALSLFGQLIRARVAPDQVTMVAALSACAELGDLKHGRRIHTFAELALRRGGEQRLVSLDNSLLNMYLKCGDLEHARMVFQGMTRRTTATWSTLIAGLAMHGREDGALSAFEEMRRRGDEKPDGVTLLAVLSACGHAGRVNEGVTYFKGMVEHWRIEPRAEHYGCVVDMLSRAGRLGEARDLVGAMPVRPTDAVWGALLSGCMMGMNAELASHAFGKLMELAPVNTAGYHVLLSNAYAAVGRWGDARRVRELMEVMKVKKPAGLSWISINLNVPCIEHCRGLLHG